MLIIIYLLNIFGNSQVVCNGAVCFGLKDLMKLLKSYYSVGRELTSRYCALGLFVPRHQLLQMTQSQEEKCFQERILAWGEFVRLIFGADLKSTCCLVDYLTCDTAAAGNVELAER